MARHVPPLAVSGHSVARHVPLPTVSGHSVARHLSPLAVCLLSRDRHLLLQLAEVSGWCRSPSQAALHDVTKHVYTSTLVDN